MKKTFITHALLLAALLSYCQNIKPNTFDVFTLREPDVEIHDHNLMQIAFETSKVYHTNKGNGGILEGRGLIQDDSWSIALTAKKLNIISTQGIALIYDVAKIEFNDTTKMQRFILAEPGGSQSHQITVVWSKGSNNYIVNLTSLDWVESFSFQNVVLTSKLN